MHQRRSVKAVQAAPKEVDGASKPPRPLFHETTDGIRREMVAWDASRKKFSVVAGPVRWGGWWTRTGHFLKQSFIPDGVSPDYFTYTKWRILQRLVSATVSVFGTRALLLALGVKTERVGAAATFNWIQKDAFGKFGRIMWASKMGRRFDMDAKRWRFRSSLLYATGTGLEIFTYVFPAGFLLLATLANTLKQISMLTSSATRNAMYKSFAGDGQNLGDITAKGEAQIAVVDLLGILIGIFLSKAIGTAQVGMAIAYIFLSVIDVFAIYNEIRSVVFKSLNLERTQIVINKFVSGEPALPTPYDVSRSERIFLNPEHINYSIFKTISQTGCSIEEIKESQEIFVNEKYLVTNSAEGGPVIVLHVNAKEHDILKSILVLNYLKEDMNKISQSAHPDGHIVGRQLGSAQARADANFENFEKELHANGWDTKHLLFGKIRCRTEW